MPFVDQILFDEAKGANFADSAQAGAPSLWGYKTDSPALGAPTDLLSSL